MGEAEAALQRALELDPTSLNPRFQLMVLYAGMGDTARARRQLEQLPDDAAAGAWIELLSVQRNFRAALAKVERMEEIERTQDSYLPRTLWRARLYRYLGEQALARVNLDSAVTLLERDLHQAEPADEPTLRAALGLAYAGLGRRDDALREGRRATALIPISLDQRTGASYRLLLAETQTLAGDLAGAIAGLDSLLRQPSSLTVPLLRLDPRWDPLRGQPGFHRLVGR